MSSGYTINGIDYTGTNYALGFTPDSPGVIASLLSMYPASALCLGKYACVSDLYGSTNEVMRCCLSATTYYWRPQRTDYGVTLTAVGGTVNLTPLLQAPSVFLNGTLASNLTISLSTTNAWPGASFQVANSLTFGLLNANFTGLPGGGTLAMLPGISKSFVYDGANWRPF